MKINDLPKITPNVAPMTYWTYKKTDGGAGIQNSQNVGFGDTPGGAFNLNQTGLFDFVLIAYDSAARTKEIARTDITVQVPEPGTIAMFGLGLASLIGLRRRKDKQA